MAMLSNSPKDAKDLEQWFSTCGAQSRCISVIWEIDWIVKSQDQFLNQKRWEWGLAIGTLTNPSGDSVYSRLRTTALESRI